ncbi:natural cytotoxicity triggering receptor 3-like isoform X2 [Carcharodon carcharias]|uniref:natural cytotoxicity triggering receptor 3-like isoform X2 n=1 Tax=Carcharodon carcharias TaxID=13397 RepID=UPI001B7DC5D4|nr:natural cytotoxicity triggering receptor 3-like isoform X2 [Carcharodon carcharias]
MYPDTILGVLLISAVAAADIKVTQSPPVIELTEGEEFQLTCTFTTPETTTLFAVAWYKEVLDCESCKVMNKSGEFIGRVLEESQISLRRNQVTVMDARQNDSGIYYCEIESIQFGKGTGTGTRVTVKAVHDRNTAQHSLVIFSSLLVVIVSLLLTAVLITWRRCKHQGNDVSCDTRKNSPARPRSIERTSRTREEEQGGASNNVAYADLRIVKPKTNRTENHRKGQSAGAPSRTSQRDEDTVVYATVGPRSEIRNQKRAPKRPPTEMEKLLV